jgi:hypothetical protein
MEITLLEILKHKRIILRPCIGITNTPPCKYKTEKLLLCYKCNLLTTKSFPDVIGINERYNK